MLEARSVYLTLGGRPVLDSVSLALRPGEILALAGPNGAGKSSLLAILSGATSPGEGEALIDGAPIASLKPSALALRRAVLEQHPSGHPGFGLRDLVALSVPRDVAPDTAATIVETAIDALDLRPLAGRPLAALSGGERHRAHMARALAQLGAGRHLARDADSSHWLLLDEPTASLDPRHQGSVLRAAREAAQSGAGVLVVLHDLTLAAQMADRIALMRQGRIVAVGPPAAVLTPERLLDIYEIPMVVTAPVEGRRAVIPLFT